MKHLQELFHSNHLILILELRLQCSILFLSSLESRSILHGFPLGQSLEPNYDIRFCVFWFIIKLCHLYIFNCDLSEILRHVTIDWRARLQYAELFLMSFTHIIFCLREISISVVT